MKTILFVSQASGFFGGGEVSLFELMRGLDPARFRSILLCPEKGELRSRLEARGIQVRLLPMPSLRGRGLFSLPSRVGRIRGLIREQGIQIVHANSSRGMLYGGLAGRAAAVPVIWHVRVTDRDPLLDRLLGFLAARIIVNSGSVRERLSFLGPRPGKVTVVYNGIDTRRFSPAVPGTGIREKYSIEAGEKVVAVVGRLDRFKGHDDFLDAARGIAADTGPVRFLIVGDGEMRPALQRQCRALGLEERVHFCGQTADVPRFLAASDVVVSASLKEGFGRTVAEAMAVGKPVVATRVGGVPEIVEDEKSGLLVDPADPDGLRAAVVRLLSDAGLAAGLAAAGRRRVEDLFSLESHVAAMERVYDSL